VELFVAVLGASSFTYAEASWTQRSADFIGSHGKAFAYFGGVSRMVVPDQLKSAVSASCRYEPGVQRTYGEWARHYHTAVVPARPGKPRDKAKVEVAVQVAQRWILARLRHEVFFSLEALNARIRDFVDEINDRPMRRLGGQTRRELYARYDQPALLPLPETPFEHAEWKQATVNVDYHVELEKHWYSIPYPLVRERVEIRATATTVEVFHRGQRVASHVRSDEPYRHTTDPAHMPEAHRRHFHGADAVLAWASSVGPMTEGLVRRLLEQNPIREVGWRSARGLQRVGERYGPERTELACTRALALGARSYKPVAKILELGREQVPLPGEEPPEGATIRHENVRGPDYYH
jgi:transposase